MVEFCHSPLSSVCWLSRTLETLDAALYKFRINSLLCVVLLHVLHGKLFVGFRLTNTKCMQFIEQWKKIQHANVVQLREVFTTKAFADNCKALHVFQELPSACYSMTPECFRIVFSKAVFFLAVIPLLLITLRLYLDDMFLCCTCMYILISDQFNSLVTGVLHVVINDILQPWCSPMTFSLVVRRCFTGISVTALRITLMATATPTTWTARPGHTAPVKVREPLLLCYMYM